ncbi:CD63 antigen [Trichomycterus rosablanca]|uniref:CD63 antigen n=1 Tax=Trichomycterus rosablanca TaxID=2290929 RepID=UPI002F35EFCC
MALDGGMKCVKFLLFFFNFIFWLCGLALIVVGILALTSIKSIPALSGSSAPVVIIVVGVVIFFIAFFGCCGAWKENHCMVSTFAVLLSIIILVEIGTAIAAYIYKDKLPKLVDEGLMPMIRDYNTNKEFQAEVDNLQKELHCCGLKNSTDWKNYTTDSITVPDSCCRNITKNCGVKAMNDNTKIYTQGCSSVIEEALRKNIIWVGIAVLVIAFIEIMGVVFACVLMRGLRKGYEVM